MWGFFFSRKNSTKQQSVLSHNGSMSSGLKEKKNPRVVKLPVLSQQLAIPRVKLGRGKCCWSLCWSSQAQQTPYGSRGAWSCSQLACRIWDNGQPWVSALVVRVEVPLVHASFMAELSFQSKVWWCKASFILSFFFLSISLTRVFPQASRDIFLSKNMKI